MSESTPAQRQAEFLAALAEHLLAHPQLKPVSVAPSNGLHVWDSDAPGLAAWFASVGATDLRVSLQIEHGYAAVHAYQVPIGGHLCKVWDTVDGLERHLVEGGQGHYQDGLRLSLAELAYFAEHGALPEAGAAR